jgi:hypothetical protein
MQKGEVVEEGDHDSLIRTRGVYFTLVEQQNLRQAEKEDEQEFEEQECMKMLLAEEPRLDISNVTSNGRPSLISISPSILAALYGRRNLKIDELEKKDDESIKSEKVI